jgi:hypothetical protein
MPVQVVWDDAQQTIIRTEVKGIWTWEEYHEGTQQVFAMMAEVDHDVVGIINTRDPKSSLPKGNPIPHFNSTARRFADYPDLLIINVNPNGFMRAISGLFMRLQPSMSDQYRQTTSLDDARALLRDHARP